jgi:hypothetical protein
MFWNKPKPKRKYKFAPLPDITAYEVAKIVPLMIPNPYAHIIKDYERRFQENIMALPPECFRHILVNEQRLNEVADQLKQETEHQ